jgi:hypothetical protein
VWAEYQALDHALCGRLDNLAERVIAATVSHEAVDLPLLESAGEAD